MNGLIYLLKELKQNFKGKFIIPQAVKKEVIDRPLTIKRFQLGAIRINSLLKDKVLELPASINISEPQIQEKTREILKKANNSFLTKRGYMEIIQKGEAACLALSMLAKEKGIEDVLVVDERTTRMLGESPENLRKLFEKKLHTKVQLKQDFNFLRNLKFIRSSELAYIGYKKNLIKLEGKNVLEALLYATKFKGASISRQEIEEAKRLN